MFTLKRDPWEKEFEKLNREISVLFEEAFGIKPYYKNSRSKLFYLKARLNSAWANFKQRLGWNNERELIIPALDIFEAKDHYQFKLDLPGVKKSNLNLRLKGRNLRILGKGKLNGVKNVLNQEIEYGNYYREFELPDEIDPEKLQAKLENGLLTIKIPRVSRTMEVEILN